MSRYSFDFCYSNVLTRVFKLCFFFNLVYSYHHVSLHCSRCPVAQSCPFATPWTVARQASLSLTISLSLPKFMSIELVMPSSHLILWCPLLLLPSIFPSIRDFSSESSAHIRWPKYWNFSFSISLSSEYSGFIFFKIDWFDLLAL